MNKRIEIKLVDPDINYTHRYGDNDIFCEEIRPHICKHECENILKEAKKANITTDEMINAIVAEMYEKQLRHITIDIDGREEYYKPAKEMTLSEIEAVLGYKVKIINEQKGV